MLPTTYTTRYFENIAVQSFATVKLLNYGYISSMLVFSGKLMYVQ